MLWSLLLAGLAWGQDGPPPIDVESPPIAEDTDSWVQLVSGEWLKGEFTRMRSGDVEFDSDKLDGLALDFDDIVVAWIPRSHIWTIAGRKEVIGPAVVDAAGVRVRTAEGIVFIPRDEIQGSLKGSEKEKDRWDFNARLGFTGRWGNSEQLTATGSVSVIREDARTRWTTRYTGSLGFTDKEQSINQHKGVTQLDVFITKVFNVTPVYSDLFFDRFQNIAIRSNTGAGLGVSGDLGKTITGYSSLFGIFQYLRSIEVEPGEDDVFMGGGLSIGAGFDWDITPDFNMKLDWQTTLILNDLGRTSHRGVLDLSVDLTKVVSLYATVVFDRVEKPIPTAEGTPKPNDLELITGVSVEF